MPARITAFARSDLKAVSRDTFLLWMSAVALLSWVPGRALLSWLTDWLAVEHAFDLHRYYPLISTELVLVTGPPVIGLVFALLIMDELDSGTFSALRVSPLRLRTYVAYRAGAATLIGAFAVTISIPLTRLASWGFLVDALPAILAASAVGALFVLLIPTFSTNKIAGLAIFRGINLLFFVPGFFYFTDSAWQYLAGVVPWYWPYKAYFVASDGGNGWLHGMVGVAYCSGLAVVLYRRLERKLSNAGRTTARASVAA